MKVLIITEVYPPLARAAGRIMRDIALEFRDNGHFVDVITTIENSADKMIEKTSLSNEDNINVLRIIVPQIRNVNIIKRGIGEELIPLIVNTVSAQYFDNKGYDLVITYSPPINFFKVIKKYKKKGCKAYLVLRDIHPQTGRDLGVINSNLLFNFYRGKEKKLYKICDFIGVQSPANKKFILENNRIDENKVDVLYNWKRIDNNKKVIRNNYRMKFGLENKIICLYAGNMSNSQDLKGLIDIACRVKNRTDIVFLIIGFGPLKKELETLREKNNLENFVISNALPLDEYDELVQQCDIGIIHLNKSFKTQNFPGKFLDYLYAGIPILASVNPGNDIMDIINNEQCGFAFVSGEIDHFEKSLIDLVDSSTLRRNMGNNGKELLFKTFSSKAAYYQIINTLKE